MTIPRRIAFGVRDLFALQPRLEHPRGRRALRLLEMPRFRAAYDLLVLRAGLGLAAPETATWWTHLQTLPEAERERMAENSQGNAAAAGAEGPAPARPRRRRRRRRPGAG